MKYKYGVAIIIGLVFVFLFLPLATQHCGSNGFFVGWSPDSTCQMQGGQISLNHLNEMMDFLSLFIVGGMILFTGLMYALIRRIVAERGTVGARISLRLSSQGVNSFYHLMKPYDGLLFVLAKIYRKHFAFAV